MRYTAYVAMCPAMQHAHGVRKSEMCPPLANRKAFFLVAFNSMRLPALLPPLADPVSDYGRNQLVAVAPTSKVSFLESSAVHDAANLIALPVALVLMALSIKAPQWRRPLAQYLLGYMVLDVLWICCKPSSVRAPSILIIHHAATTLLLAHALTFAQHLRYVAWLSVVVVSHRLSDGSQRS